MAPSGPPADAWYARDLFPLPQLPTSDVPRHVCRKVRQRRSRVYCRGEAANSLSAALNRLYGLPGPGPAFEQATAAQLDVLSNLEDEISHLPIVDTPKTALKELLGNTAAAYDCAVSLLGPAPFQRDLVSLPDAAGRCALVDHLDVRNRIFLERNGETLFLGEPARVQRVREEGRARAYWDPLLQHNDHVYSEFIRDLSRRSMIRFEDHCKEKVGVFCVKKKSGRLRLIIDCRRVNQRCSKAPSTALTSSGFFGALFPAGHRIGIRRSRRFGLFLSIQDSQMAWALFRAPAHCSWTGGRHTH